MKDHVSVTGMGILTSAGRGVEATLDALLEDRPGLGPLTRFPSVRCGHFPVAEVRDVSDSPGVPRTVAMASIAMEEALASAHLETATPESRERTGLVLGTCVGGMPETEEAVAALLEDPGASHDPSIWSRHECAYTSHALAAAAGICGPVLTISNACSSGNQAVSTAVRLLECEEVDIAIAGGVDALCRLTLNGFASLLAMDPDGCRPFDKNRKGMSLGEGAAFLVLEKSGHALRRGVRPLVDIRGSGNTCDAFHPTAPHPEGQGAEAAMRMALLEAQVEPGEIDYVNAHGTGTPENDRTEGLALSRVFGEAVPPVSSTKRVFGHTLAAAGAVEAVVCVLALTRRFLPGTCGLLEVDPDCRIRPLKESRSASPKVALSNSFGFGGSNTVLCLGLPGAPA